MRNYFGTNIMFRGAMKGTERGKSYRWVGSARHDMPYVSFFNKHPIWKSKNERTVMTRVLRVLIHEPIHQILWKLKLDPDSNYDVVRQRFINKHEKGKRMELKLIL